MSSSFKPGFTLIEIIVALAVMSILLGIAIVGMSGMRASNRDTERKADVENIVTYLDSSYATGFPGLNGLRGSYPSRDHISVNGINAVFSGFDQNNLKAPGSSSVSLVVATNSNQTESGVRPIPTTSSYVYQPINSNGNLCTTTSQECRKFNIYYRLETQTDIQKSTSKNQ